MKNGRREKTRLKQKRIWMGGFHLESNTSNPVLVEAEDFLIYRGEKMLRHFPEATAAVQEAGYEILPALYAESACVAGGVLSLRAFRQIAQELIDTVLLDGSIDGVWLYLHGSMQVEFIGSGEAFLVGAIRERVGPSVPISVAMDFHGNISHTLVRVANLIVGYRTAPHVDIAQTQATAAALVCRAVREGVTPWASLVRVPMLQPGEAATTDMPHIKAILQKIDAIQDMEGVWRTSYFTGMSWIDCPQNGSVIVVCGTARDRKPIEQAMLETARYVWEHRGEYKLGANALQTEEAVRRALESNAHTVLLSDSGDNVTAGAPGDNAFLLKYLLERKAEGILFAGLWDEKAVAACAAAGVGASVDLAIGAKHDTSGTSVLLRGAAVKSLHQTAVGSVDGAVLSVQGVDIALNAERTSFTCEADIAAYGLDYRDYHVIVVKLGYLYPGLAAIQDDSYIALTHGAAMLTIDAFQYHEQRRPLYPFDDDFAYDPAKTLW